MLLKLIKAVCKRLNGSKDIGATRGRLDGHASLCLMGGVMTDKQKEHCKCNLPVLLCWPLQTPEFLNKSLRELMQQQNATVSAKEMVSYTQSAASFGYFCVVY